MEKVASKNEPMAFKKSLLSKHPADKNRDRNDKALSVILLAPANDGDNEGIPNRFLPDQLRDFLEIKISDDYGLQKKSGYLGYPDFFLLD